MKTKNDLQLKEKISGELAVKMRQLCIISACHTNQSSFSVLAKC